MSTTQPKEPTIMPVRPKTISATDKATLRKAGVIVIECENPSEIRLIKPSVEFSEGDLFSMAMKAIKTGNDQTTKIAFTNMMIAGLENIK